MALWSGCESAACDHLSCGESATRNLIDLGRRDFLRDTVMAAAGAIAVRGNRIAGVGAMRDLEHLLSAKTVVIDARDHTVIPGINDAHTHFIRGGLTYTNEVRWDGVPSLAEAMRRVREQARRTPPPHWVQVIGGWTWAQFGEKRFPTLEA